MTYPTSSANTVPSEAKLCHLCKYIKKITNKTSLAAIQCNNFKPHAIWESSPVFKVFHMKKKYSENKYIWVFEYIQYVCSHLSKQRKPLTSTFNSQLQVVLPTWLWNYSKKVITWFCKVELRALIESKHSMPWANNLLVHTLPTVKSFNKSVCELVEG